MIARFQIYIPLDLFIPVLQMGNMKPQEFEIGGTRVVFHPPYHCKMKPGDLERKLIPLDELEAKLERVDPQPISIDTEINGGAAIHCNAIQIDFIRNEFNRSRTLPVASFDPSLEFVFNVLNDWITRARLLAKAPHLKPVKIESVPWRLSYLNDDESQLEMNPELVRRRSAATSKINSVAITEELWDAIDRLKWGYQPVATDTLLLDAQGSIEEIGPAIVLAFTALETRIGYAIDILAQTGGVKTGIWEWINDRGDYRKAPSVSEQFDSLLKAVSGETLKSEPRLWEGFNNLRNARNSFAHDGQAAIGKNKKAVDSAEAARLINIAREIADWIDGLLPPAERRPSFTNEVEVTATFQIASSAAKQAGGADFAPESA